MIGGRRRAHCLGANKSGPPTLLFGHLADTPTNWAEGSPSEWDKFVGGQLSWAHNCAALAVRELACYLGRRLNVCLFVSYFAAP